MEQITKKLRNRTMSAGLAMLVIALTGCSQDDGKAADATGQGDAQITLSVEGIVEGTNESLEKTTAQSQTVVVPADDSGMLMECTLEPTAASKTRSTALTTGYKYRFAVLNSTTNAIVAENVFASGTAGYLTGLTASTLYKFVAVSYNNTTDPGSLGAVGSTPVSISGIAPSTDLLYASGTFTTAASESVSVPITFSHKFAQVTAQASASYNGWTIGVGTTIAATLATGCTANFATVDGTLTSTGTTATQSFDFSAASADTLVSSAARTVYLGGASSVNLNFSKITINSTAYTNKSVSLTKTLAGGTSYTLRIRFRRPIFAGCNIYWDGTKLTFDAAGTTTHESYQGVFFKWGSLIGVSPARYSSSTLWSSSQAVYVPTYSATASARTWTKTTAANQNWTTWSDIPYLTPGSVTTGVNTKPLFSVYSTPTYYQAYKGDICTYLSGQSGIPSGTWRLPTSSELSTTGATTFFIGTNGWTEEGTASLNIILANESGTAVMTYGGRYLGALFPACGYRNRRTAPDGRLFDVNLTGLYLTGSAYGSTYAYHLYINSPTISITNTPSSLMATGIRCVKD